MKLVLLSMPDVAPVTVHPSAFHMPNLGIASLGANIDDGHEVYLIDLIRKRRNIRRYLGRTLSKIRPHIVGLSAMTWQFHTCLKIIRFIKRVLPEVMILIGGYHVTLMYEEIADSADSRHIDFMIRGEGEEALRRLINALGGDGNYESIPSLSYRNGSGFIHNPKGELLDLSRLKRPIRDHRRLTWGYHIMFSRVEVIETSRGCTRNCNFCSIRHMYGRSFRPFPIARILADIDAIYHDRRCRWIFIADDNFVLSPPRVNELCSAIAKRRYRKMKFIVQADCMTIADNEDMVRRMAEAGFHTIFLGIENVSKKNLRTARKGDIVDAARKAIDVCHRHGIKVIGGLIFGFPDDGEQEIIDNYRFSKSLKVDTAYGQILTPYPKTGIRQYLQQEDLVTNRDDFSRYNGMWANVRTRHLDADTLQYMVWYYRHHVMGWGEPSAISRKHNPYWTLFLMHIFRPLLMHWHRRSLRKYGWRGLFESDIKRLQQLNHFEI